MTIKEVLEKSGLTPHQIRVLEHVARGKSNQEIADLLHMSQQNVKFHITSAFKVFKVDSRSKFIVSVWQTLAGLLPTSKVKTTLGRSEAKSQIADL